MPEGPPKFPSPSSNEVQAVCTDSLSSLHGQCYEAGVEGGRMEMNTAKVNMSVQLACGEHANSNEFHGKTMRLNGLGFSYMVWKGFLFSGGLWNQIILSQKME